MGEASIQADLHGVREEGLQLLESFLFECQVYIPRNHARARISAWSKLASLGSPCSTA